MLARCLAILGLMMALPSHAQYEVVAPTPLPDSEVAKYDAGFAAIQKTSHTYQAFIAQKLKLQGLAKPVTSMGNLYYVSPDKLLIRFIQPPGEWMLVNGSQSAIQKTGKPLETHDLSAQGPNASHATNLLDFFHADPTRWHKDFDVTMYRSGDELYVHLKPWMTPGSTSQGVQEVMTTLKLPAYDLVGMRVQFNGANYVEYRFFNGQRNAALDPALFTIPTP